MLADVLLVIDVQVDVVVAMPERAAFLAKVNRRIGQYRAEQRPILFIQHSDEWLLKNTAEWALVPELDFVAGQDLRMDKTHANGFFETNLQEILSGLQAQSLEFCGAQTEFCVNSTLVFAHGLGYRCQMQHGLSATVDNDWLTAAQTVDFYENHLWQGRFLEFVE